MKPIIFAISVFYALSFLSCSAENGKPSPQAISTEVKKEIEKMDSIAHQLDRAGSEIDKKAVELETALKNLDN